MAYRSRSRSRFSAKKRSSRSRSRGGYKSVKTTGRVVRGYTRTVGNYGRFQGVGKPELKWFDTATATTLVTLSAVNVTGDSSGVVWLVPGTNPTTQKSMCLIGAGSGASERIGRKVTLRHLESKLSVRIKSQLLSLLAGDAAPSIRFRWVVVIDHQCNGTDMSEKQLFASINSFAAGGGGTQVCNTYSPRNLANLKRFTVLCDKVFVWTAKSIQSEYSNATPSVASSTNYVIEGGQIDKSFKTVLNLPIEYDLSAGVPAITNVRSNNIVGFLLCDASSEVVQVNAYSHNRLRYSDV